MKKIIGLLSLVTFIQMTYAQDFKKVQGILLLKKYEAAKDEYEKTVAKKASLATTAEGVYIKAVIYDGLAKDSLISKKYPTAFDIMHASIEEYLKMDTSFKAAKDYGQDPFFTIYFKAFKDGVAGFSGKEWNKSADHFDEAVKLSDLIFSRGWANSKQKFDTTSLMYAGYAHQNAGNKATCAAYYKRLIDAKINSNELIDAYRYLLVYYIDTKDKSGFDTYYKITQAAYPAENWFEYKTDYIDKHYSMEEKITSYNEMITDGSITEFACQMFGDMFMAGKSMDGVSVELADNYLLKAQDAYKKAYSMNANNFAAAFIAGISYYNQFSVLHDKVAENIRTLQNLNTNRPAPSKDPKKKLLEDNKFKASIDSVKKLNIALDQPIMTKVDAAIEWIEKSYNNLKDKDKYTKPEKNVISRSVDFLATLYGYKRDKSRGKDQKAYDDYDAKYNFFDKLHDKYQ
ncbi:MAG: hypothetical protein NTW92_08040 [Bacteroidetes bacterium]|nr:hypothetical protein [Bacteroidota bacterium]